MGLGILLYGEDGPRELRSRAISLSIIILFHCSTVYVTATHNGISFRQTPVIVPPFW